MPVTFATDNSSGSSNWLDCDLPSPAAVTVAGATTVVNVDLLHGNGDIPVGSRITVPTITWPTPAPIPYGTALGDDQLDAAATAVVNGNTVDVPGQFTYSPAAGTVLGAGQQTLSLIFTPSDTLDYAVTTASTTITVLATAPTVTGISPAEGPTGGGTVVTITGTDLTGATAVTFRQRGGDRRARSTRTPTSRPRARRERVRWT